MLREGRGWMIPHPEPVEIPEADLARLVEAANRLTQYRRYDLRADSWGRGFIDNPVLAGLLGEQTLACYLNRELKFKLKVNTELLPNGDGDKDFIIENRKVQVKNRRGGSDLLIRREAEDRCGILGRLHRINSHIIVKTSCPSVGCEYPHHGTVDGWIMAKDALDGIFEPARRGSHWNITVPDERLLPAAELVEYFRIAIQLKRN